jgi:hypothetical protein
MEAEVGAKSGCLTVWETKSKKLRAKKSHASVSLNSALAVTSQFKRLESLNRFRHPVI